MASVDCDQRDCRVDCDVEKCVISLRNHGDNKLTWLVMLTLAFHRSVIKTLKMLVISRCWLVSVLHLLLTQNRVFPALFKFLLKLNDNL